MIVKSLSTRARLTADFMGGHRLDPEHNGVIPSLISKGHVSPGQNFGLNRPLISATLAVSDGSY